MIQKGLSESDNSPGQDKELAAWLDEQAAFDELRPLLLEDERYRDKYVAVHRHAVVDSDVDKFRLVRRIMKSFPSETVFVSHVRDSDAKVELPSPEIKE